VTVALKEAGRTRAAAESVVDSYAEAETVAKTFASQQSFPWYKVAVVLEVVLEAATNSVSVGFIEREKQVRFSCPTSHPAKYRRTSTPLFRQRKTQAAFRRPSHEAGTPTCCSEALEERRIPHAGRQGGRQLRRSGDPRESIRSYAWWFPGEGRSDYEVAG